METDKDDHKKSTEELDYNTRKIPVKPEILIKYLGKTVILVWGENSIPAQFHRIVTDEDDKKVLRLYFQVAPEESKFYGITNPYEINVEELHKELNVTELHLYELGVLAFTK